ncbi:hypothetical protein AB9P05_17045 [Roseivirga sp. BDSF3-8]|uniref:hypothetical protein n=1 Tax=Roseivirga sp. BDSF3-8 TaxID=3241598 RepID=UPI0035325DF5
MRLIYSYKKKFLMMLPAMVFAFWAVACNDVEDKAVYEQDGDLHTEYETMNEEPHYQKTESEYTPFDDSNTAKGGESVNEELVDEDGSEMESSTGTEPTATSEEDDN